MFAEQIGQNTEAYMHDMLVKSKQATSHITDLTETFEILWQYKMKLNPDNCGFGVSSRKFLGFMVNQHEIEANHEKVQVVLDMQPPQNLKQLKCLNELIVTLNRFVS